MKSWLRQLFCHHRNLISRTTHISEKESMTKGHCLDCGKPMLPGCERCGR